MSDTEIKSPTNAGTDIKSPTKSATDVKSPTKSTKAKGAAKSESFAGADEIQIQNLNTFDPFADADEPGDVSGKQGVGNTKAEATKIHIRIQQRNGRKTLTTVQGIPSKFDLKRIIKVMKSRFACNGTIVTDEQVGKVIQLQGDQRKFVFEFLTGDPFAKEDKDGLGLPQNKIETHGF